MAISDLWLKACQFTAFDADAGEAWGGSGMLLRSGERGIDYLVSARHCFTWAKEGGQRVHAKKFMLLIPALPNRPEVTFTDVYQAKLEATTDGIIEHPQNLAGGLRNDVFQVRVDGQTRRERYDYVDVAAVALGNACKELHPINFWKEEDFVANCKGDQMPGSPVSVLGWPEFWPGELVLPLARSGALATPMAVNLRRYPAFAIDALAHAGTSGGPVIWNPTKQLESVGGSVQLGGVRAWLAGVFVASSPEAQVGYAVHASEIATLLAKGQGLSYQFLR